MSWGIRADCVISQRCLERSNCSRGCELSSIVASSVSMLTWCFPSHFVDLMSISTLWAYCGVSMLHLWTGCFLTSRVGMIVLLCWLHGDLYRSLDLWNACIRLWAGDLQLLSLRDGFSLVAVHVLWHYHWFTSEGLCFDRSGWHLQLVLVSGFASSDAWLLTS
ncbi:hypothetical protein CsSME_00041326 [Camellia sinensis var. sinensis]